MSRRYHLPWSRTLHILSPVPVHPSDNDAGGSGHLGARANRKLSRRALLRSAASLGIAAAVTWHASLSAQSSFRFIVVNDLHHGSRECDPFFASLVRQMRSHGACCSRLRDNHDGSLAEGYLLCTATADGRLSWEFVEFVAARKQ
jgi:hypothetical protein